MMVLLAGTLLAGSSPAWAESRAAGAAIVWQQPTPQLFERAQRLDKLVFVNLTAEWCQFCKKMEQTTYRDANVIAYLAEYFVAARLSDEESGELAQRYRNHARPGTVVLNADGVEILHKRGYLNAQLMQWMLAAVVAEPTPEAHK
jgi:uncharacterized protein